MLVYPFDPQCRLESNWIPKETLSAFPSKQTRTLVPTHAPFFIKDCKVFKGGRELKEGEDFYFSIKHGVASHATGYLVHGGITIIKDELIPPFTIQYHPQGGTFEATNTQIKAYLDRKPDIWDGRWEKLINSDYYPPVKIIYDHEAFVSEEALIAEIGKIEHAVKAKDESEEINFNLFRVRIENLRKDIERLRIDEHIVSTKNSHGVKAHHVGALHRDGIAANSKRIGGLTKAEFIERLLAAIPPLSTQLTDKFKQGDDLTTDSKVVLDGGTLTFGDTVLIEMDDEHFSQLGDNSLTLVADAEASRPGTKLHVNAGGNELTIASTGSVQDNTRLRVNEEEIITEATLKSYAFAIINKENNGITTQNSASLSFIGRGAIDAPMEVVTSVPVANGDNSGTVKVVNEGSHGYPCPGYLNRNFYIFHKAGNQYIGLRNGADDLESDVFITNVSIDPLVVTPTAERFRPRNLPNTAIPTSVRHGTEDIVWLDTTDGPFVLLTNRNPDYHTWKAVKILNAGFNLGYAATPFVYAGKIYVLQPELNGGSSYVRMWEAAIPSGNSVTLTARTLTGTNCNGTAQNSTTFSHFDKMWGNKGEKCYAYSEDGYYDYLSISHAGDQFDYCQSAGQVRVCHNGIHYTSTNVKSIMARIPLSFLIDLTTGRVIEDAPGNYPIRVSSDSYSVSVNRYVLGSDGGNWTINGKRANGKTFAYMTYDRLTNPTLLHLENSGSMSELDNCRWNAQYWRRAGSKGYMGLYGTKVHSGLRGATVFGKNRIMAVCMDNSHVDFRYDPYGSYSPTLAGYGPTNDRENLEPNTHRKLKQIVWVNEEEGYVGRGVCLWANRLAADSTYEGGYFGNPVSITDAQYMAVKKTAVDRFVDLSLGAITDSTLTLMIHRVAGVPQLGQLQVIQEMPNSGGQRVARYYVFNITTDRSYGAIGSITVGTVIRSGIHVSTARDIEQTSDRLWNTTALIHKLEDGGCAIAMAGARIAHIGNTSTLTVAIVRGPGGDVVKTFTATSDTSQGVAFMGTRELGFGLTGISSSGEGLYLNSYGRTSADIVRNYDANTPARYVLALSRSDAGDNVVVSQYAATKSKERFDSLIPPVRQVQGMDLTVDRVITRAMLPNSKDIVNTRDRDYPAQQSHRDSLTGKAPVSHTHNPGDFTMADATYDTYGVAKLATVTGDDDDAVTVAVMADINTEHDRLLNRTRVLNKLDQSIDVNYEV